MRATLPVLLLVALAGCHSVFSASLDFALKEDLSDERVEISDLQKSDESKTEAESEEEGMGSDNCFGKALRDHHEQKFNPTSSSASEEMTQDAETQSTKEGKTEDKGTEVRAEVKTQIFDREEENSDEAEERFDIEVLRHAAGQTAVAVE